MVETKIGKEVNFMHKKIFPLLAAVLLALTIVAGAVEPRAAAPKVGMAFDKNTVTCVASVRETGKQIKATLELWCGTTRVDSWSANGTSHVEFEETASVSSGKTYRLVLSGTIDGKAFTPQSITKPCP